MFFIIFNLMKIADGFVCMFLKFASLEMEDFPRSLLFCRMFSENSINFYKVYIDKSYRIICPDRITWTINTAI